MPPKPSLKQQYQDLCEESEDAISCDEGDGAVGVVSTPTVSECVSDAIPVIGVSALDQQESMEFTDVLDGSWFPANRPKRSHAACDAPAGGDEVSQSQMPPPVKKKRTPLPPLPVSKTQASDSSLTVLIAQAPASTPSSTGVDTKRFTHDPIALSRGLKEILDFSTVKDVRVNKHRNIIAVEFCEGVTSELTALLGVTSLGPFAVRCYTPASRKGNECYGVIGPIHEDVNLEELLPSVVCDGFTVTNLMRLPKFGSGSKELSRAVKITFSGPTLPSSVRAGFLSYPVRAYREPPLRCYRCQRLGHMASGCSAKPRCLVCGESHLKESCQASVPRCVNCGGPHVASSRECPRNQDASRIDSLVRGGLDYRSARLRVAHERQQGVPPAGVPSSSSVPSAGNLRPSYVDRDDPVYSASPPGGLTTGVVVADVHQSQGSYYIPRRLPNRALNFAAAASSQVLSSGALSNPLSCASPSVHLDSQPLPDSAPHAHASSGGSTLSTGPLGLLEVCEASIVRKCADLVVEKCESVIFGKCQELIATTVSSLFAKMSALLVEIFSLNLHQEGKKERQMLLIGMVRNHFGPQISEPLLERHQQAVSRATPAHAAAGASSSPGSHPAATPAPSGTTPTPKSQRAPVPASSGKSKNKSKPATRTSTRKS